MTGATFTSAGGGGVEARTLLLLQPSELDTNAAPIKPAKIFFFFFIFIFIIRFLAIESLTRKSPDTLQAMSGMWHEDHFVLCYTVTDYVYFVTIQNMQEKSVDRDAARRRVILDAARDCILRFGYAKCSLEDIAKQAAISRPLIYRKFKSKEEIFGAVLEDIFETQYRAAEHVLAKPGSKREKLTSLYEVLLLDPWKELIVDAPMGAEFYAACSRVTPDINERHRKVQLKYTQAVLGTKEVSEVFMLAVDGLHRDLPATRVLRRRLEVLIDRFVRD